MNRRRQCFIACALIAFSWTLASAQTAQSPLPAPTGYVNDYAQVIDADTQDELETMLTRLDRQQQVQFAVVTVDSTNGQDTFAYSLAVARGWGLGNKDAQKPSLLLLVAVKDRKAFTLVSRHLEGDLPDGLTGQIQREKLVPAFRAGDYGRGINDTLREYISILGEKRGFSTDSILGAATTPRQREVRSSRGTNLCGIIVVLVIVIVIISIFSRRGGGSGGGWVTWMILSSLLNSGRGSSSGWSGGGFGGFGGSGGSSGGGFGGFGGGGDFGGGGSGASW